jgi:hypothetical protein
VAGGRLKIDWRILPSFSVFANAGAGDYVSLRDVIEDKDGDPHHVAQYLHVYAGLDFRWNLNRSNLVLSGGWRSEREPRDFEDLEQGWRQKKRLAHWEGKLNVYVGGPWTVHLSVLHEWRMKRELENFRLQPVDYHWGTHIVGVDYAGKVSLSGAFEYDTDKATYDWYGWWQIKWFVRENLILAFLGGSQRGGLKCVGGVCKMVPAFAGVRTELVFRY